MPASILMNPIGYVRSARTKAEDDGWNAVSARIELDAARFGPDALAGLEDFSHMEVLFYFHAAQGPGETGTRVPRNNPAWPKTGIFAQRAKDRPNHIGATICRILSVHESTVELEGLDAIDGTPVLDIKPVLKGFLPRGEVVEPGWATELMARYW
jgi:tRNA-Thr(GGU) m(6)t(6)A37 methyltransferase TsaA